MKPEAKEILMRMIQEDSLFLKENDLIDYSLFLIQIRKRGGVEVIQNKSYFEFESDDDRYILRIGLIDFLTLYDYTKDVENRLKSTVY